MREWTSQISSVSEGKISTYGFDQIDILRNFSFEEMIFVLLQGRKPSKIEGDLLRAVIVSHVSHGITGQSTLAVRMGADCGSSFLHSLIAGFSAGAGIYHQGALQGAMLELIEFASTPKEELYAKLETRVRAGRRVIGYGHRFHKKSEPRADALMALAAEHRLNGAYLDAAREVSSALRAICGVPMNIDGAGGAILLELGFRPEIAHLFIVLGRGPMLAAAYLERLDENDRPFPKLRVFDADHDR